MGEHRVPSCRGLHYVAATASLSILAWAAITLDWRPVLLAPIVGYGLAWIAHFGIEHNRPATWGYVRYSLMAEYKMFFLGLTGRMDREMERLYGSVHPAPDAPCRESNDRESPPGDVDVSPPPTGRA